MGDYGAPWLTLTGEISDFIKKTSPESWLIYLSGVIVLYGSILESFPYEYLKFFGPIIPKRTDVYTVTIAACVMMEFWFLSYIIVFTATLKEKKQNKWT